MGRLQRLCGGLVSEALWWVGGVLGNLTIRPTQFNYNCNILLSKTELFKVFHLKASLTPKWMKSNERKE